MKNQDYNDIIVTALEGGINYWCDSAKAKGGNFFGQEFLSEILPKGGTIILKAENKEYELTFSKLKKGIAKFRKVNNISEKWENIDYDATDADCIIQYAIFGKIIYG